MAYDEFTAKLVADNERLRQEIKQNEVDLEEYRLDVERLRAALHPFAEAAGKFDPDEGDGSQHVWGWSPTIGMLRKARAALEVKND